MTHDSALRADASLPEVLAARARSASDGRLALDLLLGTAAGIGVAIWRPGAWVLLTSMALCFAAFGAWGIADRELAERAGHSVRSIKVLRSVRAVTTGVGAVAGVSMLLSGLALLLGTWIS